MEGIYQVKWLRRIKVVDQPYLTIPGELANSFTRDPKTQLDSYEFGPKSVITYPSGTQRLAGRGYYVITGLAWSGGGDGAPLSKSRPTAERVQRKPRSSDHAAAAGVHTILSAVERGTERSHSAVALRGRERTAAAVRRGICEVPGAALESSCTRPPIPRWATATGSRRGR